MQSIKRKNNIHLKELLQETFSKKIFNNTGEILTIDILISHINKEFSIDLQFTEMSSSAQESFNQLLINISQLIELQKTNSKFIIAYFFKPPSSWTAKKDKDKYVPVCMLNPAVAFIQKLPSEPLNSFDYVSPDLFFIEKNNILCSDLILQFALRNIDTLNKEIYFNRTIGWDNQVGLMLPLKESLDGGINAISKLKLKNVSLEVIELAKKNLLDDVYKISDILKYYELSNFEKFETKFNNISREIFKLVSILFPESENKYDDNFCSYERNRAERISSIAKKIFNNENILPKKEEIIKILFDQIDQKNLSYNMDEIKRIIKNLLRRSRELQALKKEIKNPRISCEFLFPLGDFIFQVSQKNAFKGSRTAGFVTLVPQPSVLISQLDVTGFKKVVKKIPSIVFIDKITRE